MQVPSAATAAQAGEASGAGASDEAAPTDGTSFAALVAGMLPGAQVAAAPAPEIADARTPDPASASHSPGPLPDLSQGAVANAVEQAFAIPSAPFVVPPPGASRAGESPAAPGRDGSTARRGLEPLRAATAILGDGEASSSRAGAIAQSEAPTAPMARIPDIAPSGTEASMRPDALGSELSLSAPQSADASPTLRSPEAAAQPTLRSLTPPAAESALHIDSPPGTPRWRDELATSVSILVRNATSEAEIRVTPAELGPVHVRISVDGGTANIVLGAPTQEIRDALEGSLGALRERLGESGIALGEASVSGDSASSSASRDDRTAPGRGPGAHPEGATPMAEAAPGVRRDGLIDLYA